MKSPQRDGEDVVLLQRIVAGDENALSQLYDRYGQLLYSFVMKMLRSVEDAEEIIQEVFLQLLGKAPSYENSKGTVYTWLVTMTRTRTIDRIRSKGYKRQATGVDITSLMLEADARSSSFPTTTVASDYQKLIVGAMSQLHYEQQQIIALAYYEGYNQTEIAEKLNIPLATVTSRMRKGLTTMRSWLDGKM